MQSWLDDESRDSAGGSRLNASDCDQSRLLARQRSSVNLKDDSASSDFGEHDINVKLKKKGFFAQVSRVL